MWREQRRQQNRRMKVLVLGGTHFIGGHIVQALLAAGHGVSVFNRGVSADALPAPVLRLRGDRDAGTPGLAALAGLRWDACVDVSGYTPAQVRASAELLHGRVARYLFISAVMVYGDPDHGPVDESFPVENPAADDVHEVNGQTYGPLKVACEALLQGRYGAAATLLRPQVVVGPGDPWQRYSEWAQRALRSHDGAAMLAPGDGSDPLQVVDVRDLARFVVTVLESDLGGVFNLSGPRLAWRDFMALLGARHLVWMPADRLQREGLGAAEMPLFRPAGSPRSGLMDVSHAKAVAAGLRLTEPALTAADVLHDCRGRPFTPALARGRELELIREAGR